MVKDNWSEVGLALWLGVELTCRLEYHVHGVLSVTGLNKGDALKQCCLYSVLVCIYLSDSWCETIYLVHHSSTLEQDIYIKYKTR